MPEPGLRPARRFQSSGQQQAVNLCGGDPGVAKALDLSPLGLRIASLCGEQFKVIKLTLLVAFAGLMLLTAGLMLFRQETAASTRPVSTNWWVALASGAGVGLLTGILGVGGGFLIVPALVMLVGLPMSQAVGTSLAVIAANSLAGFAGHLDGLQFDPILTLVFVAAGLLGTFAGARIAQRLNAERLKQIFALFVIALAFFLLVDNLPKMLA